MVARGGTAGYERYEETFSGDMLVIVIVVRVSRVMYIYVNAYQIHTLNMHGSL